MTGHGFELIVGNVGTVFQGDDREMAYSLFVDYVERSKSGRGRAGGEPVTLLKDGEILEEYHPDTISE